MNSIYNDLKQKELLLKNEELLLTKISTSQISIFNASKEFKNSFIFYFKNEEHSIHRVENTDKAIHYDKSYGPSFGKTDLSFYSTPDFPKPRWKCKKKCYEELKLDELNLDRYKTVNVEDYEDHNPYPQKGYRIIALKVPGVKP
ncbi:4484_t:CDS:2 [Scutellospora calospora]|uniref:4484_t:CDS:1 n=1 Tax=Scutellospora calospora TaxID=85575 RepID=A0ACA9K5D1_9GLOM|nr:4484_t:CDS:2 [Scutellospora calospora]